jgi:hypothetical protein
VKDLPDPHQRLVAGAMSVSVRAASARLRTSPVTASRTARSSAAAGKITPTSVSQLPATTSCGEETSSTTRYAPLISASCAAAWRTGKK